MPRSQSCQKVNQELNDLDILNNFPDYYIEQSLSLQTQEEVIVPMSNEVVVSGVKPTIDLSKEWRGDLESRPVYTAEGVNTMRSSATNAFENFGNPFSEAGYGGTIKVASIGEAVVAYKEWLLGTNHQDVKPQQREWILDQINQGKLDGATLLYAGKSEARGQGMHPTALAEVVEQLRTTKEEEVQQDEFTPEEESWKDEDNNDTCVPF